MGPRAQQAGAPPPPRGCDFLREGSTTDEHERTSGVAFRYSVAFCYSVAICCAVLLQCCVLLCCFAAFDFATRCSILHCSRNEQCSRPTFRREHFHAFDNCSIIEHLSTLVSRDASFTACDDPRRPASTKTLQRRHARIGLDARRDERRLLSGKRGAHRSRW